MNIWSVCLHSCHVKTKMTYILHSLTTPQAERLLAAVDYDGDGCLGFDEFYRVLTGSKHSKVYRAGVDPAKSGAAADLQRQRRRADFGLPVKDVVPTPTAVSPARHSSQQAVIGAPAPDFRQAEASSMFRRLLQLLEEAATGDLKHHEIESVLSHYRRRVILAGLESFGGNPNAHPPSGGPKPSTAASRRASMASTASMVDEGALELDPLKTKAEQGGRNRRRGSISVRRDTVCVGIGFG